MGGWRFCAFKGKVSWATTILFVRISKGRLIRPMGRLSIPELIRLNYALLYQLDLNEWVWRKEAYERYLRYHR